MAPALFISIETINTKTLIKLNSFKAHILIYNLTLRAEVIDITVKVYKVEMPFQLFSCDTSLKLIFNTYNQMKQLCCQSLWLYFVNYVYSKPTVLKTN